jgi:hypothetical protein
VNDVRGCFYCRSAVHLQQAAQAMSDQVRQAALAEKQAVAIEALTAMAKNATSDALKIMHDNLCEEDEIGFLLERAIRSDLQRRGHPCIIGHIEKFLKDADRAELDMMLVTKDEIMQKFDVALKYEIERRKHDAAKCFEVGFAGLTKDQLRAIKFSKVISGGEDQDMLDFIDILKDELKERNVVID